MADVLQVDGLRKRYGDREAVAGVSLSVGAGEVLGLLGPNGAGKSTTVGMISGITRPDAGQVSIAGHLLQHPDGEARRRIGLVPQDLALFDDLSAHDNVRLFGSLYGLSDPSLARRSDEVLALVGLAERARDRPATFSGGMKRRLNIACALVHDPELLLLDEPTAGVDPQSRLAIFDNLEQLRRAGMAIVYTTHYMEEVERLADRIVVIDQGRVVAQDTLAALLCELPMGHSLLIDVDGPVDAAALSTLPGIHGVHQDHQRLRVELDDLGPTAAGLLQRLVAAGASVRHLSSGRANLEEVFLKLTGHQLRDDNPPPHA